MIARIGTCQRNPTSEEMLLVLMVAVAASTQEGWELADRAFVAPPAALRPRALSD